MMNDKLREALADEQHAIWAHWMKYMFTQGEYNGKGNWIMPYEKVVRWQRQMNTDYDQLTEQEKASDRDMADRVIKVIDDVTGDRGRVG